MIGEVKAASSLGGWATGPLGANRQARRASSSAVYFTRESEPHLLQTGARRGRMLAPPHVPPALP